jgi:cytidylate kinase
MPERIQSILERQAGGWERSRLGQVPLGKAPATWGRVVCIAREVGAGSSLLAEALGERLGFQVYDRSLVQAISERAHIRDQLIESVDEHVRGGIRDFISNMFSGDSTAHWRYEQHLAELVLSLGHHGNCVIVGRGANFLIPRETCLSIRLVADRAWRIEHIAKLREISVDEAGAMVDTGQREREAFIRKVFGQDPNDAHHYDLVLNSSTLPLQTMVAISEVAFRAKFPGLS